MEETFEIDDKVEAKFTFKLKIGLQLKSGSSVKLMENLIQLKQLFKRLPQ